MARFKKRPVKVARKQATKVFKILKRKIGPRLAKVAANNVGKATWKAAVRKQRRRPARKRRVVKKRRVRSARRSLWS